MTDIKHTATLTKNQKQVMAYLGICSMPATPREIGDAVGPQADTASSWASGVLRALARDGLVIRNPDAPYYQLTESGRTAINKAEGRS